MARLTVALAGATGLLGIPMINALTKANHKVVVLTRQGSTNSSKLPKSDLITIKEVDYKSTSSITQALNGVDAVVSTLGAPGLGDQMNLINAAFEAGVQRFVPSEFGCDTANPNNKGLPVYGGKVASANRLGELAEQNPKFTYTLFYNNLFFDSGIKNGFIIHPATHTAKIYDGGDVPISATRLSTIAKAVTNLLDHLDETKNRIVYVHDAVVTQNQLIGMVKEIDGKEWELTPVDTRQLMNECYEELKKPSPDFGKAMIGFLPRAIYGEENGGDFSGKTDNELLGVKSMSEQEVREMVKGIVQS